MDAGFRHRNQPPARPPADHATGGRGRPNRGEVRDGQSARWPGEGGTLIRHAAADPVGALAVAVVEAPFEAALMPGSGGPHRAAAAESSAPRRAVGLAAVTRRADGERAAAVSADLLAERDVHGVGARGAVSDWTTRSNRGTTAPTGSFCRSSGRSRGSGGHTGPSPHVSARCLRYLTEPPPASAGGCGRRHSCGRKQPRPQEFAKPRRRGFAQRPQPIILFCFFKTTTTTTTTATGRVCRQVSRIDQIQVSADTSAAARSGRRA